jgi:hypothetical protein
MATETAFDATHSSRSWCTSAGWLSYVHQHDKRSPPSGIAALPRGGVKLYLGSMGPRTCPSEQDPRSRSGPALRATSGGCPLSAIERLSRFIACGQRRLGEAMVLSPHRSASIAQHALS